MSVGVESHVGRVRTENQDRITRSPTPFGDLFVVADGMGGYKGGAEAAQAVVDGFSSFLQTHGAMSVEDALQLAAQNIALELQQRAADNPELRGFGSTVVLCILLGNRATYAHAGDSRLYLVRERRLIQLTQDHSVIQRLVSQGVVTPDQAEKHADSSVLTRAIGPTPEVSLDIGTIELAPGDALLLCSDGLWAYAQQEEMEAVVASESLTPAAVASALLRLALDGGGEDNISIQFLRFSARRAPQGAAVPRPLLHRLTPVMLVAAAVMAVGALAAGAWNFWHPLTPGNHSSSVTGSVRPAPGLRGPNKAPAGSSAAVPGTASQSLSTPDSDASDNDAASSGADSGDNQLVQPRSGTTTRIVIIGETTSREPGWVVSLRSQNILSNPSSRPSPDCNQLRVNQWVLYYTSDSADDANRLATQLNIRDAREMPPDFAKKCGGNILVATPRD